MTLYSCRHDGDQYRITKFTNNLDVESSYLCTFEECECPAGVRPSCRHRQMLPMFVDRGAINTGWMLDFDRGGWIDNRTEDELNATLADEDEEEDEEEEDEEDMPPLPEGVEAVSLEDPAALHNAIAEAVGEPEARFTFTIPEGYEAVRDSEGRATGEIKPHSAAASTADFDSANAGSNPAGVATQVPAAPLPAKSFRRF